MAGVGGWGRSGYADAVQKALTPQWATVVPFGMTSQFGHDVPGPPRLPNGEFSTEDIQQLAQETANLDDDVKLFFTLGNAVLDASIAAWAWKFKYDFVRPITGIREEYRGRQIVSWLGPYRGYGLVDGGSWIPYQELRVDTDNFGASVTIRAGTSRIEPRTPTNPGSPAKDVTLSWPTFSAAEAGMSRRYGGIHFPSGDYHGRDLGKAIGADAWNKTQSSIRPFPIGPILS